MILIVIVTCLTTDGPVRLIELCLSVTRWVQICVGFSESVCTYVSFNHFLVYLVLTVVCCVTFHELSPVLVSWKHSAAKAVHDKCTQNIWSQLQQTPLVKNNFSDNTLTVKTKAYDKSKMIDLKSIICLSVFGSEENSLTGIMFFVTLATLRFTAVSHVSKATGSQFSYSVHQSWALHWK